MNSLSQHLLSIALKALVNKNKKFQASESEGTKLPLFTAMNGHRDDHSLELKFYFYFLALFTSTPLLAAV